jgi:hypothetical protein
MNAIRGGWRTGYVTGHSGKAHGSFIGNQREEAHEQS